MAKSLFPSDAFPACKNCLIGRLSFDQKRVLCMHNGVMDPDFSCKKYRYNPFKRVPRRAPLLPKFEKDDFEL